MLLKISIGIITSLILDPHKDISNKHIRAWMYYQPFEFMLVQLSEIEDVCVCVGVQDARMNIKIRYHLTVSLLEPTRLTTFQTHFQ